MVTLGLLSLVFAAFMLYRRRDIKRLFAYSSIEHMGIITFAFGMGGPLANFAGLLHMTMHSLTKSAIFFAVGHIAQVKGTQRIADIGGLTETHPVLGWGLVLGVVAIAGLPPLGIFMSEFLMVSSTFARAPLLALVLVFGLLVGVGALFLRLNSIAFGEPRGPSAKAQASYVPMFAHLALVLAAGIYLPPALVAWFQNVAGLLGLSRCRRSSTSSRTASASRATGPGRASSSTADDWRHVARELAAGRATLARPVGRHRRRAHGAHGPHRGRDRRDRGAQPRLSGEQLSLGRRAASARHPARARHPQPLSAIEPVGAPDARPWLDHGFWDLQHPLGTTPAGAGRTSGLRVPAGRGREPASDPGRPGARRHHRARAFPLHRQRRDGGAARGAARLRAQGHRGADGRRDHRASGAARRAHLRRQHRRLCDRLRAARSRRRSTSRRRRARTVCAR